MDKFKKEAQGFISNFESETDLEEIKEEKLELLNQFKGMDKTISVSVCEIKEENPFEICQNEKAINRVRKIR